MDHSSDGVHHRTDATGIISNDPAVVATATATADFGSRSSRQNDNNQLHTRTTRKSRETRTRTRNRTTTTTTSTCRQSRRTKKGRLLNNIIDNKVATIAANQNQIR